MTPSKQITTHIKQVGGWRGTAMTHLRKLIREAAPDLVEEWKWNTPVWSRKSNVLALGAFEDHVKVNFFNGASLDDPDGLFNAGLDAKASRAIDIHEGDRVKDAAFKKLVRAAAGASRG
jgi:hypothetical protein